LLREIGRYNAQDATEVSRRIRATTAIDPSLDELLALYSEVIAAHQRAPASDPLAEGRAAAAYLQWLTMIGKKQSAQHQEMLANSLSLRLRNRIGRFRLLEKPIKLIARAARRKSS
jgi:hypothetical protein